MQMTREEFCKYLREGIIADTKAAKLCQTASDLSAALYLIENPDANSVEIE